MNVAALEALRFPFSFFIVLAFFICYQADDGTALACDDLRGTGNLVNAINGDFDGRIALLWDETAEIRVVARDQQRYDLNLIGDPEPRDLGILAYRDLHHPGGTCEQSLDLDQGLGRDQRLKWLRDRFPELCHFDRKAEPVRGSERGLVPLNLHLHTGQHGTRVIGRGSVNDPV